MPIYNITAFLFVFFNIEDDYTNIFGLLHKRIYEKFCV